MHFEHELLHCCCEFSVKEILTHSDVELLVSHSSEYPENKILHTIETNRVATKLNNSREKMRERLEGGREGDK